MYRPLGTGRLISGEVLELGVIDAPDRDWVGRLKSFLHHKGPEYLDHIDRALHEPLDKLDTYFYVGRVNDQLVAHVMVAGSRGLGILAHVYTAPGWRRRGALRQLMTAQMQDVKTLGFTRLTLSTGFDSMPYRVYESFGFRSAVPKSGHMHWRADPAGDAAFLAASDTAIRQIGWHDWGAACFVLAHAPLPGESTPRSPALGIDENGSAEGRFLRLLRQANLPGAQSWVAESSSGALVGWCHLVPSPLVLGDTWLLDLHVLPGFEEVLPRLIGAVEWPDGPIIFSTTAGAEPYERSVRAAGFTSVATLPVGASHGSARELAVWLRKS